MTIPSGRAIINPEHGHCVPMQCRWKPHSCRVPTACQAAGIPCNKIPSNLFNSIGQAMINLYPDAERQQPRRKLQLRQLACTQPERNQVRRACGSDFLQQRHCLRSLQLRPGHLLCAWRWWIGSFAEAGAFGSNQRIANHARNIALSETHVFSAKMLNQASFGYNRIFDYILSQGTGTCASAKLGIPGANLGCWRRHHLRCRRL